VWVQGYTCSLVNTGLTPLVFVRPDGERAICGRKRLSGDFSCKLAEPCVTAGGTKAYGGGGGAGNGEQQTRRGYRGQMRRLRVGDDCRKIRLQTAIHAGSGVNIQGAKPVRKIDKVFVPYF